MDREKVYFVNGGKFTKMEMVCKALQQCTMPSDLEGYETQCSDCPYFDLDCSVSVCKQQLCDDAIALLKEQQEQIDKLIEESASNAEMAEGYAELLKKQEAKLMIENERGWNCPSCGMNLIGKSASGYPCDLIDLPEDEPIHFCPLCGQAVKRDDD